MKRAQEELPKISKKTLKTVSDVLLDLKKEDGTKLVDKKQASQLVALEFEDGENILSLEYRWFLYEVVWMLDKVGFDQTYNFLSADWEKVLGSHNIRKKMLFENPLMEKTKEKVFRDMDMFRNKVSVEMGELCKRCGSENTVAVTQQTRSNDEMSSIKITCLSCGYKWMAQ